MYDILNEVINKLYDRRYQHKDIAKFSGVNPATLNRIRSSPVTGYSPKHETLVKIMEYFDAADQAKNQKFSEKFSEKGEK